MQIETENWQVRHNEIKPIKMQEEEEEAIVSYMSDRRLGRARAQGGIDRRPIGRPSGTGGDICGRF